MDLFINRNIGVIYKLIFVEKAIISCVTNRNFKNSNHYNFEKEINRPKLYNYFLFLFTSLQ